MYPLPESGPGSLYLITGLLFFISGANSLSSEYHFVYMKRLYRSGKEQMPGGICGGPGEHRDVDPGIMRLVWLVVTLLSPGTGIIVCIAAWIIIPQSPGESPRQTPAIS
jgi:phage shock protein C